MGGTKGSHLVVDPFPGAPKGEALYVEARKDGRPYFIVPWNGRYLIGTTDLRYEEDLDYVRASEEEIQYLLDETNYVIPEANLSREDVLFTYSGVRPLPYNPEGETGGVTRSHVVFDHATGGSAAGGKVKSQSAELPQVGGLLSIIGGKLTTYLNLGRQTTDAVYKKLDRKAPKSTARKTPLPGSETADFAAFAAGFKAASSIPDVLSEQAPQALRGEGVRGAGDGRRRPGAPNAALPIESVETALIGAEVIWAFREEMAADTLRRAPEAHDGGLRAQGRPRRGRGRSPGRRQAPRMGRGTRRARGERVPRVGRALYPERVQGSRTVSGLSRRRDPPEGTG